jgi:hypothetical protein
MNIQKRIEADRMARERARQLEELQRQEKALEQEKAVRKAHVEGRQVGEQAARNMQALMAHPIAEMMLKEAGAQLGRLIAEKADEAGTPGSIAIRCAEEVWNMMTKSGMPLEEAIRVSVSYHAERIGTEIRVDVPAMSFTNMIEDHRVMAMSRY